LYEEAIDVYLTCLTVVGKHRSDDTDKDQLELFFKTMNNLAFCTLQLKWYGKTVEFCTLALKDQQINDGIFMLEKARLFFKRAKASRLRGDYRFDDIDKAKHCLETSDQALEPELHKAILQERRLLEGAIAQAQVNRRRQEASMKRLLNPVGNGIDPLYEASSLPEREFSTIRAPSTGQGRSVGSERLVESYWALYVGMVQRQARKFRDWLISEKSKSQ
jgi:hypothetical protein